MQTDCFRQRLGAQHDLTVVFVVYRVFIPGRFAGSFFYTSGGLSQERAPTGLDETAFGIDG